MSPTSHPSRPDRFCRVTSLLCILTLLVAVTLLSPAAAASPSIAAHRLTHVLNAYALAHGTDRFPVEVFRMS